MLRLHGVPLSQPFRSVAWTLLQKRVPFEVSLCVPGSGGKRGSKQQPLQAPKEVGGREVAESLGARAGPGAIA